MKPLSKDQMSRLRQAQPAILLGMHRSGTTLVTRLLRDVGIHMGHRLSSNAEAIFFQKLNRCIFSDASAKWSNIESILQMMNSQEFVEHQINAMQHLVFNKAGIENFFGTDLWNVVCDNESLMWGWKDPRTTITFPIWIHLFPKARFVHVIRNGIDVAISLHRRTQHQRGQWRKRFFSRDYSPNTLEFHKCFSLWEQYMSFILEYKHLIPREQYLEIRYENLLAEPYDQLQKLLSFLDYPIEDDLVHTVCTQINRERLDNSQYAADYRDEIPPLTASTVMQKLEYNYNLDNLSL